MVKFGRNKFRALNKLAKKQNTATGHVTNRVLKKKINAEKKVSFQKEVLIKEAVNENSLVKKVSKKEIQLDELLKKASTSTKKSANVQEISKPKLKPVKKQKQRQKMQISDTKLLMNLMKKK